MPKDKVESISQLTVGLAIDSDSGDPVVTIGLKDEDDEMIAMCGYFRDDARKIAQGILKAVNAIESGEWKEILADESKNDF